MPKNISVIGLGKLGACIVATLASKGFHVLGYDASEKVALLLNGGKSHVVEPRLAQMLEQFKKNGQGEAAESWVGPGLNKEVSPPQLKQAIGQDVLATLVEQTGLSQDELLARLSRELPTAVDKYTPDGRLPPRDA